MNENAQPWYRLLNRYHWFVFVVAALGWLFDTMDQQLFNLARMPAMQELLAPAGGGTADPALVNKYGPWATSIFLMGWATGGLTFGVLGDRYGRAKVMLWTILVYSVFTGVSAFSRSFWDFALWRFLTGLGVGGEFAVGVALVAEVMPEKARPFALGLLQALSAVGNITAALISLGLGEFEETLGLGKWGIFGFKMTAWRVMFVLGTVPALLCIVIRQRLKEPERWQSSAHEGVASKTLGLFVDLFSHPVWRKRAILGMVLASAGVIGLWGIGFFSIDLNRSVFRKNFEAEARAAGEGDKDRQFVRLALAQADQLTKLQPAVKAADLLSLAASPQHKDASALYDAILETVLAKEEVSAEAVLARLDQANSEKKRPAQSAEDRQRRAEFLAGEAAAGDSLEDHARRISERGKDVNRRVTRWVSFTSLLLNVGAFFGIYGFSLLTHRLGRRPTFALAFVLAGLTTAYVFLNISKTSDVLWMIPLMGFAQLSLFGGYAIYFPELFPTRLRSTGTSFCYNVGRFVAGVGPFTLGHLASDVFGSHPEPYRPAGAIMCSIFVLGLIVLPFCPETRGEPLPE